MVRKTNVKKSAMKESIALTHPEFAAQWHPGLNGTLTPDQVTFGSHQKVWWLGDCGHEWDMVVKNRVSQKQGCPYCSGRRVLISFNDLKTTHPDVAAEWHPTLNGNLFPTQITAGSHYKAWWHGECNHEWEMVVKERTGKQRQGCPICSGNKVLMGFNDLATTHPNLTREWHPSQNNELTPKQISAGSNRVVWWLGKCGHEWKAVLSSRSGNKSRNCPICAGQKVLIGFNDLASQYPQLSTEWHPTKNNELKPYQITNGSNRKVWWLGECGHEWQANIGHRVKGSSCPVCAGQKVLAGYNDLAIINPKIAKLWHPTKNNALTPNMVTAGSSQKVWWLGECGHEWDMPVAARTGKCSQGCPICSGKQVLINFNDLTTTKPLLAAEWHPTKNRELLPEQVSSGSDRKVWWLGKCNHEWASVIRARSIGQGCPTCAAAAKVSRGEQEIADYLAKDLGLKIEQSNRRLLKGRTEVDIYVPEKNLAIEYNGLYWHSHTRKQNPNCHLEKYEQARAAGLQLLQVWEDEWRDKPELVKRLLAHKLGVSQEPLIGARSTLVETITLSETRDFMNEYHLQGHANGSYYLGLREKKTNQLVTAMVLTKRISTSGLTLEIARYATSCRVPGGFTKLLKHVERELQPSRLVTFADHCISDGGLYEANGFTAEKILKPDYRYFVNLGRVHKFGYRLKRFRTDPNLLWKEGLTETQLAQLNGLHRIYDAGKTRWVKTLVSLPKA